MNKKPLIIYHADCPDGFCSAFIAWLTYSDNAEYVPVAYGTGECPELMHVTGRDVFILDFSYERDQMEYIFSVSNKTVWLDHHTSAYTMWVGNSPGDSSCFFDSHDDSPYNHYVMLDTKKSGAILTWEYFNPGSEIPKMFLHIDDYDRWKFDIPGSKEFNAALRSYQPWTFEQWREWWRDFTPHQGGSSTALKSFISEGESIIRGQAQHISAIIEKSTVKCNLGFHNVGEKGIGINAHSGEKFEYSGLSNCTGLAANCPPFLINDVGTELAKKSGTFGLCWYIGGDGLAKCSLRSVGNYDVSNIAKYFGGGGHKNAAGFTVDFKLILEFLKS